MILFRALPAILFCVATAALQTACEKRPDFGAKPGPDGRIPESWHFVGEPDPAKVWKPTSAELNFEKLYALNCIACHGMGSTIGAAISMDNQTYLNLLPADVLKNTIINGVKGTRMPGYGAVVGGDLTEAQIDVLTNGILALKKPLDPATGALPPYSAPPGNAANGQALFNQSFAKDKPPGETYLNPAFLGLVSDQYLRTLVIVGQPELGYPDYRNFISGHPMNDQEVSDVVAWLISNRKNEYGAPLVASPASNPPVAPQVP
ncbi:MAG: c-type cytochrome [Chthoniobacterales bacterium]